MKNPPHAPVDGSLRPIVDVARTLGIEPATLEPYGRYKAKLPLSTFRHRPLSGRLVLVSAITPTPAGEGKTTMTVGLTQGLVKLGVKSAAALREPSLGPVFGMKGGGAGGGRSEVLPAMDVNLHFNGDFHAISSAHNLLAAIVDNALHYGTAGRLDPRRVTWKRVVDMNDRALRNIVVGLGGKSEGVPRETGFEITAASEVMAILCLARDVADLKARLARIVVGYATDGSPVTAGDIGGVGAMAALLAQAIKPNLVQTTEGAPAFVHGGPFANIAHGTNSIAATRAALSYADIVVTEAGFAFDLGAEKFFDITCRYGGLEPACTVIVATVRALKMHGGKALADVNAPDVEALRRGLGNLDKHIESARAFGQSCIVAINHFPSDTIDEVEAVRAHCARLGITAVLAKPFTEGGAGCLELAEVVRETVATNVPGFTPLYDWSDAYEDKIAAIARTVYGASGVEYTSQARRDLEQIRKAGFAGLPVCIAKTHQSLSDDPTRAGRPRDFTITVREVQLAAGAGFVVPITGDLLRMPGLPRVPMSLRFDLSDDGEVVFT
ncbi:MAG TPA: formate--tetrahydrofolate ligase [Steroidobacteraceae bacterium]|nr:formate--tetrahydrofolate ligase [Steroidobacteraceae bacterium]